MTDLGFRIGRFVTCPKCGVEFGGPALDEVCAAGREAEKKQIAIEYNLAGFPLLRKELGDIAVAIRNYVPPDEIWFVANGKIVGKITNVGEGGERDDQ